MREIILQRHSKNSNLKQIITKSLILEKFLIKLCIMILLSGGVSFAADGLSTYKLLITKEGSATITSIKVVAKTEEEAVNETALNGWKVLKVELIPGDTSQMTADDKKLDKKMAADSDGKSEENMSKMPADFPFKDEYKVVTNRMLSRKILTMKFELGKYTKDLTAQDRDMLDQLNINSRFIVAGHTDNQTVSPNTDFKSNLGLSIKRAQFLKNILLNMGINESRITVAGFADLIPADKDNKMSPVNRRVELYERRK